MKLTPAEINALKKLQKHEKNFRKMRYVNLGLFLLLFFVSLNGLYVAYKGALEVLLSNEGRQSHFVILIYSTTFPPLYVALAFSGGFLAHIIKNWKGNPEKILLIGLAEKLMQASEEDKEFKE